MAGAGVLLAIAVIASAWGNYPLNDDWQYARAARILADTNTVVIDTSIAPSLVGQLFLAWPFMKVFGFSHLLLRLLTMVMAGVILWSLDRILEHAHVTRSIRIKALVLVALQPWFVDLALSFMTECWGYGVALAGAAIWLDARRACDHQGARSAVPLWASLLVGALVGASFWIRQFCVVVYPALLLGTVGRLAIERAWGRLLRTLPRMILGAGAFAGVVTAYFSWAEHKQLLKSAFSGPLSQMLHFTWFDYKIVAGLQLFYLGASFLPVLATWPLRARSWLRILVSSALALALGKAAYSLITASASDNAGAFNLHRLFPFTSNVIHTNGIGPNTLTDVFFVNPDRFAVLSFGFWQTVTYILVGATVLWGLPLAGLRVLRGISRTGQEIFVFAIAFSVGSLVLAVQSYGAVGFDRYYLPLVLGAALALAVLLHGEERLVRRLGHGRLSTFLFVILTLPLAFFTVASMHDYFRWNDARWRLVARTQAMGVPSTSIDGGYEVNGDLSFDLMRKHPEKIDTSRCIGSCHCEIPWGLGPIWTCYDSSYRVGMSIRGEYEEIAREEPNFWLGRNRPVILMRRTP
jgi:hypothetical protein